MKSVVKQGQVYRNIETVEAQCCAKVSSVVAGCHD